MARVEKNALAESLRGRLDNLIFKKYKFGVIVSKQPDRSKVKLSKKQKQVNQKFQEAAFYAQQVLKDPRLQKKYAAKLKKGNLFTMLPYQIL